MLTVERPAVLCHGACASTLMRFPRQKVLVVGDVMLDEYVWGSVHRLCPEAPVPVVEMEKRSYVPGGAANTAANVAGLRAQVVLAAVVGADEAGRQLSAALAAAGIGLDGLLVAQGRTTTSKTRILAQQRQVLRLDREDRSPLLPPEEAQLWQFIEDRLSGVDACVLADYAKGVVSATLARRIIQRAVALGKPVVVDPKGADPAKYRGATLVKPNLHEASLLLRRQIVSPPEVLAAGQRLLDALGARAVLLTRGAAGMSLFEAGAEPVHLSAQAREVYDVTGAGDTVAATLAVALAAGASPAPAAHLAGRAAGVVVGRVGTAAIRLEDLLGPDGG